MESAEKEWLFIEKSGTLIVWKEPMKGLRLCEVLEVYKNSFVGRGRDWRLAAVISQIRSLIYPNPALC